MTVTPVEVSPASTVVTVDVCIFVDNPSLDEGVFAVVIVTVTRLVVSPASAAVTVEATPSVDHDVSLIPAVVDWSGRPDGSIDVLLVSSGFVVGEMSNEALLVVPAATEVISPVDITVGEYCDELLNTSCVVCCPNVSFCTDALDTASGIFVTVTESLFSLIVVGDSTPLVLGPGVSVSATAFVCVLPSAIPVAVSSSVPETVVIASYVDALEFDDCVSVFDGENVYGVFVISRDVFSTSELVVISLNVVAPVASSIFINGVISVGVSVVLGSLPLVVVSLPVKPVVVDAVSTELATVAIDRMTSLTVPIVSENLGLSVIVVLVDDDMASSLVLVVEVGVVTSRTDDVTGMTAEKKTAMYHNDGDKSHRMTQKSQPYSYVPREHIATCPENI